MLPSLFDSTNIPILQEVASFTEARHNVLAGNVANVDTPGYRLRDLSPETFQQRLREVLTERTMARQSPSPGWAHAEPGDPLRHARDSMRSITFLDGSDVGIEQQVTEITKNQFMHNLAISIMGSQFRLLQTAISERV